MEPLLCVDGWGDYEIVGVLVRLEESVERKERESMKYYMAPMEGLTGYIYRNAYHRCFHPMDKYFTPFLSPKSNKGLSSRELNDILPEHNQGLFVVPQILTNRWEDFLGTAEILREYGYGEVNLNLGCPSGTVVSKKKGAGFLAVPEELNRFLEKVCSGLDTMGTELSVKTRLGNVSEDEFYGLMEIYNQYPLKELVVHPRIRSDYYKNVPRMKVFEYSMESASCPVCYSGDIFTAKDYRMLVKKSPELRSVMLGRGLVANPGLREEVQGEGYLDKERFRTFHGLIYEGYRRIMSGDRNVLFKMKELWSLMIHMFYDEGSYAKKIKKAQRLEEYEAAVDLVLRDLELVRGGGFQPERH